jgi:hypothetical protein
MGNIGGNPTETTVPGYFKDMTQQEGQQQENLLKRAQARRQGIESEYKIKESQYKEALRQRMKDPNSRESMVARDAINGYAKKYGIAEVPPTATAEDLERQMPMLRDIIRGETSKINKLDEIGLTSRLAAEEKYRQRQWEEGQKEAGASQQMKVLEKQFENQSRLKEMEIAATREANKLTVEGRIEEAKAKAQEARALREQQNEFSLLMAKMGFQNSKDIKNMEIGQRNREASDKAAKDAADAQKKADQEASERTVLGWKPSGQIRVKPETAQGLREKQGSMKVLHEMADRMAAIIKENPNKSKGGKFTDAGQMLNAIQKDIALEYNGKYAKLGALAGPDERYLKDITSTSFWSDTPQAMKLIENFKKALVRKFVIDMQTNGYIPDQEAASAAPQGAPAPNVNPKTGRKILR